MSFENEIMFFVVACLLLCDIPCDISLAFLILMVMFAPMGRHKMYSCWTISIVFISLLNINSWVRVTNGIYER